MARAKVPARGEGRGISRRTLLIGGGAGVGLAIAWTLWPRRYAPNVAGREGETVFNAFLKIGTDGRVIVVVPQLEMGQGVYTALPQVLADELGADWRMVGVEPAPLSPLYANRLLAAALSEGAVPSLVADVGRWTAQEVATREAVMITGGSSSIRMFEPALREAGAAARALLSIAAARRWGADWATLDTYDNHVWFGEEKLPFGELAVAAAREEVPSELPVRAGPEHRVTGLPKERLDAPGKVDGSALFTADIRLPDMVYAAVESGPPGATLLSVDQAAAEAIPETQIVFRNPGWVGAIATNSWAADRAVAALASRWDVPGRLADTTSIEVALGNALDRGETEAFLEAGELDSPFAAQGPSARYVVAPAPSAPLETLTATVRISRDVMEVWAPTQAPGLARAVAARAVGFAEGQVTVYPVQAGGGYGAKLEMDAIEQAAVMAAHSGRPVQLTWSRLQDIRADRPRPPAMAFLEGRLAPNNTISGWRSRIAAPNAWRQVAERTGLETRLFGGERSAMTGAQPPYAIAALAIDHVPTDIGIATGAWRSNALSYTTFFNESFIDELARVARLEPLSFRMQMLGNNPRLARALTTATALGGWDGGPAGSGMGIATLQAFGSYIATLVEIAVGQDQRIRVLRAVCAVDCGRVVNPELVKQQVEGGLIHGIAAAIGPKLEFANGRPTARTLGELGLPILANAPDVTVEIVESDEAPGGVTELAVPTAAPAIANALHSLTGERVRRLPLRIGGSQ